MSGDSDSSALTQESGDEAGAAETPMESVVTGTDAGTDYAEDEDVEMRDPSLGVPWFPPFISGYRFNIAFVNC